MEAVTSNIERLAGTKAGYFEDIYKYKFGDDAKFMAGWRKVRDVLGKDKQHESLMKAQVYFYSREIGHIDMEEYKTWLKQNNRELPDLEALVCSGSGHQHITGSDTESIRNQNAKSVAKETDKESIEHEKNDSTKNETNVAKQPASFMQLMELIEGGMTLPDTEDLNIEPLNEDPTPCATQRPKKPWEVS